MCVCVLLFNNLIRWRVKYENINNQEVNKRVKKGRMSRNYDKIIKDSSNNWVQSLIKMRRSRVIWFGGVHLLLESEIEAAEQMRQAGWNISLSVFTIMRDEGFKKYGP